MSPDIDDAPLLSIADVAAKLRMSRRFVYNLILANKLVGFKIGRCTRITRQEFERYLEAAKGDNYA